MPFYIGLPLIYTASYFFDVSCKTLGFWWTCGTIFISLWLLSHALQRKNNDQRYS